MKSLLLVLFMSAIASAQCVICPKCGRCHAHTQTTIVNSVSTYPTQVQTLTTQSHLVVVARYGNNPQKLQRAFQSAMLQARSNRMFHNRYDKGPWTSGVGYSSGRTLPKTCYGRRGNYVSIYNTRTRKSFSANIL